MTKSARAFCFSAERLFADHPKIYFWTVTFAVVHDDWHCSKLFREFMQDLRREVGDGWGGLRVAELHREHGVHYHLLVTRRLAVDVVRRVGHRHGIGRIHVCKADPAAAAYLGKYLSKQRSGPLTRTGRSGRRWAKFGDVEHTKVQDVVCDSPMWTYRRENKLPWLDSFTKEKVLLKAWDAGIPAFRAAWFALRGGDRVQDGFRLALGKLECSQVGVLVERCPNSGPF